VAPAERRFDRTRGRHDEPALSEGGNPRLKSFDRCLGNRGRSKIGQRTQGFRIARTPRLRQSVRLIARQFQNRVGRHLAHRQPRVGGIVGHGLKKRLLQRARRLGRVAALTECQRPIQCRACREESVRSRRDRRPGSRNRPDQAVRFIQDQQVGSAFAQRLGPLFDRPNNVRAGRSEEVGHRHRHRLRDLAGTLVGFRHRGGPIQSQRPSSDTGEPERRQHQRQGQKRKLPGRAKSDVVEHHGVLSGTSI
jgi:hypothetical protein